MLRYMRSLTWSRLRALILMVLVLGAQSAAVTGLVALGGEPWAVLPAGPSVGELTSWLGTTSAADALAAVLRLVALGGAGWLLASIVLAVLARLSRVPAAIRACDVVTLPVVRRLAGRVVAAGLSATSVLGTAAPGLAAPPAAVTAAVAAPDPHPDPREGNRTGGWAAMPPMPAWPAAPTRTQAPAPSPIDDSDGSAQAAAAERHVVVAGDNLWDLAATRLAIHRNLTPGALSDREVHAYWVMVLAANREGLRSGDPDLIHQGETVVLPPP